LEVKVSTRQQQQKIETILREKRRTIPPTMGPIIMLVPAFPDELNTVDNVDASVRLSGEEAGGGIEDLGSDGADFLQGGDEGGVVELLVAGHEVGGRAGEVEEGRVCAGGAATMGAAAAAATTTTTGRRANRPRQRRPRPRRRP
jgi:hypothetical protein